MRNQRATCIVRVLHKSGWIVGTGFLITRQHVMTCAHVITKALELPTDPPTAPKEGVSLDFPMLDPDTLPFSTTARTIIWAPPSTDGKGDIACLALDTELPEEVQPPPLITTEDMWDHRFRVFGFPQNHHTGVWVKGHISGPKVGGRFQIEWDALGAYTVTYGFSGAAVWDGRADGIVGMVVEADQHGAVMIPTNVLVNTYPDLDQQTIPLCPYPGLFAFQERDAPFFFGRKRVVDQLARDIQTKPFVAIIGPSGSGKSSVILAGLIPRLRQNEDWLIAPFRPLSDPFYNLSQALMALLAPEADEISRLEQTNHMAVKLREADITLQQIAQRIREKHTARRLLLIVDQFEELFTPGQHKQKREQFIDMLLALTQPSRHRGAPEIVIIIALRADFLGQALSYAPLGNALQPDQKLRGTFLVAMSRQELKEAIEHPAKKLKVGIERGLTERILDAVSEKPGNLPLLEFALKLLWTKQRRRTLTHAAYEAIGGVRQALTNHADRVYEQLSESDRQQLPHILVQLVHPGLGTEDTRRRATKAEVGENNWDLVTHLASAEARLVVTERSEMTGEEIVELIHEALIREWQFLRRWMEEDRAFRTWQERLRIIIRQWKDNSLNKDLLLRGVLLDEAEDWINKRSGTISDIEKQFIRASRLQQSRDEAELKDLYEEASRQRTIALARQLAAQAELLRNQRPNLLQRSILLAIEAMRRSPSLEADQPLRNGLALLRRPVAHIPYKQGFRAITFSPDGKYLAGAGDDGNARVWIAHSGHEVACCSHTDGVRAITFSSTGKYLATASNDKIARVWEMPGGREIARWTHTNDITSVAFSQDDRYLATASYDQTAQVWDLVSGERTASLSHEGEGVIWDVAFSPDGQYLATAGGNLHLRSGTLIWKVESGTEVKHLPHDPNAQGIVFSADGRYIATASQDHIARMWDADSGREIARFPHPDILGSIVFSPDGSYLATICADHVVRLWMVDSIQVTLSVTHAAIVRRIVFSADGRYLATGGFDHTVRVCEIDSGHEILRISHESVNDLAFSPNGDVIGTVSGNVPSEPQDHSARLWDLSSGRELGRMQHDRPVWKLVFSPDGAYVATASYDHTARLWDARNGREIRRFNHAESVNRVAFSSDGQLLATMTTTDAYVWETHSGHEVAHFSDDGLLNAMAFSPDGHHLATTSYDRNARIWEVQSGREVVRLPYEGIAWEIVFSPDGCLLAGNITLSSPTARVWDRETGQEAARLIHQSSITTLAFSPDGQFLTTAGVDNTARLWKTKDGQEIASFSHKGRLDHVAFSPDGQYLATAGVDSQAYIWEVGTNREIARLPHRGQVRSITFSPDGQHLLSASEDNMARLWKVSNGREIARIPHDNSVDAAVFSPEGRYVATMNWERGVWIWEAGGGEEVMSLRHADTVWALAFSPNGSLLVTTLKSTQTQLPAGVSGAKTVQVWDWSDGVEIAHLPHDDSVNMLTFSADGRYLATACNDNTTHIWSWGSDSYPDVMRLTHEQIVTAMALSSDGQYLATVIEAGVVKVWRTNDSVLMANFAHSSTVKGVAFHLDDTCVTVVGADRIVRMWNLSDGQEVARIAYEGESDLAVFSPHGRYLAIAKTDNVIQVWDMTDSKEMIRISHEDDLNAIAITSDGSYLATAGGSSLSFDSAVRIWETASSQEVARMTPESSVTSVAFSSDGRYLATTGDDHTTRIWFWRPKDLIAEACSRLARNLTQEEWQHYLPSELYCKTCPDLP